MTAPPQLLPAWAHSRAAEAPSEAMSPCEGREVPNRAPNPPQRVGVTILGRPKGCCRASGQVHGEGVGAAFLLKASSKSPFPPALTEPRCPHCPGCFFPGTRAGKGDAGAGDGHRNPKQAASLAHAEFQGFQGSGNNSRQDLAERERCSDLGLAVLPPGARKNEHTKNQAKFTARGFQLPRGLMKPEGKSTNFPLLTCMPPQATTLPLRPGSHRRAPLSVRPRAPAQARGAPGTPGWRGPGTRFPPGAREQLPGPGCGGTSAQKKTRLERAKSAQGARRGRPVGGFCRRAGGRLPSGLAPARRN